MSAMTPGKFRHLMQCSTPAGHFVILAIDHRGNLRNSLNEHALRSLTDEEFTAFKQQIIQGLASAATAVLTDPDHGIGPGLASGALSGQVGILAPLEVTDYTLHPSKRLTHWISGWSVEKLKRMGGAGVKLLLYYHPDAENAQSQRDIVAEVVENCARHDIPFFLEPVTFSPDPQKTLDNADMRYAVVESARTFSRMGVDVLKLEFPLDVRHEPDEEVWIAALKELNAACEGVPWALLSGGIGYMTFLRQVELACQAGASGVIVGRAVWADAVTASDDERETFLHTTARERMQHLAAICAQYATSWRDKVRMPDFAPGWYQGFGE